MKKYIIAFGMATTIIYSCTEHQNNTTHSGMQHNMDTTITSNNQSPTLMQSMMDMEQAMAKVPMTNIPDKDFAAMMMAHHQGAINMINIILEKGENADLKKLATQMKADQEKEIATFNTFLTNTKDTIAVKDFATKLMGSMDGMMNAPHSMNGNIDAQFTSMMIPHHQGAIDMAKVYLPSAKDATLKTIASQIITSQEKEIEVMKGIK